MSAGPGNHQSQTGQPPTSLEETLARELHLHARVPEGPCGLGELKLFQIVLSDYQVIVLSVDHGYQIVYKGPSQPEEKQLILINVGDHYHACSSLTGFLGRKYYCVDRERSFDHHDLAHHRCKGKNVLRAINTKIVFAMHTIVVCIVTKSTRPMKSKKEALLWLRKISLLPRVPQPSSTSMLPAKS